MTNSAPPVSADNWFDGNGDGIYEPTRTRAIEIRALLDFGITTLAEFRAMTSRVCRGTRIGSDRHR